MKNKIPRKLEVAATRLFNNDRDAAKQWYAKPAPALNFQTPEEKAKSPEGLKEVLNLIERLEHGVYT